LRWRTTASTDVPPSVRRVDMAPLRTTLTAYLTPAGHFWHVELNIMFGVLQCFRKCGAQRGPRGQGRRRAQRSPRMPAESCGGEGQYNGIWHNLPPFVSTQDQPHWHDITAHNACVVLDA